MLLSIGMIVKNEEKYLEQCLTGLKQILDNVDSELIIADTGSTDRTVEIAKKLNLSIKTIDTHKENIKGKLHCASSAELRQMAIEWTNKAM